MGKRKGKKDKARAMDAAEDGGNAVFELLMHEYEDSEDSEPSFHRKNFFADANGAVNDSYSSDSQEMKEVSKPLPPAEKPHAKFSIKEEAKAPAQHQSLSESPASSKLEQQVRSLQAALEQKKTQVKELLLERDSYRSQHHESEVLEDGLVDALNSIQELRAKLDYRKEKYRTKLEDAEKFLAEREQLKKSEIFATHKLKECQEQMDRVKPTFEQNKKLVEEVKILKEEAKRWKEEVKKVKQEVKDGDQRLQTVTNRFREEKERDSTEFQRKELAYKKQITSLESSLQQANSELRTFKQQLERENAGLQSRLLHLEGMSRENFEGMSLTDCQELLAKHLNTAQRLSHAIRVKMEGESLETKCVVCLSNPRNVLLQPCSHLILCNECAPKLRTCPVCRSGITTRFDVRGK